MSLSSFRIYSFFVLIFALSGCSSNFKNIIDSTKALDYFDKAKDADYIASVPYASAQVTVNNSKTLLLILSDASKNEFTGMFRLTWLSADGDSIVTEGGRIVHTVGFTKDNLEELASVSGDYVLGKVDTWQARYDWSPGYRYGFTANVNTKNLGSEVVSTDLWSQETDKFTETVMFDTLDAGFVNTYWRAPSTDEYDAFVVKSIQYLGPNMDKVEMLMVRPFVPYRSADKASQGEQS